MSIGRGFLFRAIAIIAVLVYVLLGSYTIKPGNAYIQEWTINVETEAIDSDSAEGISAEEWLPFRVEDSFGFVNAEGRLLQSSPIEWNIALGKGSYCNYTKQGINLVIRDPIRDYLYPLSVEGYPVERGGDYFVLSQDLTGVSAFSAAGEFLFSKEFSSIITSLDVGGDTVGIGLLNGRVELFAKDGSYRAGIRPETSRINAVYGTALSSASQKAAIVHGIDPQFLSLYQFDDTGFQLLSQIEVSEPKRSQVKIAFSENGEYLLCETATDVQVMSTEDQIESFKLPLSGTLVDFDFYPELDSIYIIEEEQESTVFSIYSAEGRRYSQEEFSGRPQWLSRSEGNLYLGTGSLLRKVAIERFSK
ncbi:MAG: hypothetical protein K9L66_08635 [Spirochaetaceae bacterium]|nr:hypothetical protein [Spirochaetaceae bacterium]MCF7947883.1 hypothetical protein [Spirochaetia bacterium]MCF7951559.1 hypothetical protein [Spirochaetaceae bacterium]